MYTPYQTKYAAAELTRRAGSSSVAKLSQALLNAAVDLNPHQIDAAVFAFRSPLSKGVLLADEVGLGKTIEAGLVLSQFWAERKRRLLIIVPTSLRKQWNRELLEKFSIPSLILETPTYRHIQSQGVKNPLTPKDQIVICSYHFAASRAEEFRRVPWDLVVIDEAHRLRNVYRPDAQISNAILGAVGIRPKILLTATPLQNNLMELYGLVQFLDPQLFGDERSFRSKFVRGAALSDAHAGDLKERLSRVCHRTLRRQVTEYVRFTKRFAITQDFTPTPDEQKLYDKVSEYLRKEILHAMPSGQRHLITLVFRKLLASSSFAIAGTLATLRERLREEVAALSAGASPASASKQTSQKVSEKLSEDFEHLDELEEDWDEESEKHMPSLVADEYRTSIQSEIAELDSYVELASSITENAKGAALLSALEIGFKKLDELGAQRKGVIFTESRRTQEYLRNILEGAGYRAGSDGHGGVVRFNGTNSDAETTAIYNAWKERHADDGHLSGAKASDVRAALVEEFQQRGSILITTEAGAEGINLQFASLVVNYDLPWNPQRIEQRIGRCHRYGQKHDVVVINFLNRSNEADVRVFQLLSEKFRLFDGIFGSSDEVLGAVESGVDFEKRIAQIYQRCRTRAEIDSAFDVLQNELEEQIAQRLTNARQTLLDHFDEEVHDRLKFSQDATSRHLSRLERLLWTIVRGELAAPVEFLDERLSFVVPPAFEWQGVPVRPGRYRLEAHQDEAGAPAPAAQNLRLRHPLAELLVEFAKSRSLDVSQVYFQYSGRRTRIAVLESLVGKSGWLSASLVSVDSLESEDTVVLVGFTDDLEFLDQDICEKLLSVSGEVGDLAKLAHDWDALLKGVQASRTEQLIGDMKRRNATFFEEQLDKLERWAEDRRNTLEFSLKDVQREISALKKEAKLEERLEDKLTKQRQIKDLERERTKLRRELFEAADKIDNEKDVLLSEVEGRLHQSLKEEPMFVLRWSLA